MNIIFIQLVFDFDFFKNKKDKKDKKIKDNKQKQKQKNMKDNFNNTKSSPMLLKKTQTFSTSNLNKQKLHLPSRYAHEKMLPKNQINNILNTIQTNVKTSQVERIRSPQSPNRLRVKQKIIQLDRKKQTFEFKSRPLKRQQSDIQQFKEIFISPIEQNLSTLQLKSKNQPYKTSKQTNININKEYEKLLQFENGNTNLMNMNNKTNNNHENNEENVQMTEKQVKQGYDEAIKLLAYEQQLNYSNSQENFYEEQIRIEPPDFPNSSVASTLSPGSGYAPSIPLTVNISKQNNLHELLIRAKAGMNTEDIQKQAHLSFYLGIVYEDQRNYHSALKFYRRYLGFAKGMQDKIGMALGANRVAINYFYNNDINKSIIFHNQNLKLSDNENCFAGFYNLGICHRKIQQFDEAIQYFETALQWSIQNGDIQSECITYGQIALTFKCMQLYQKSLQNFEKSLQLCRKLKKTKLQSSNLMNILLIASLQQLYNVDRIYELTCEAYQCAKVLDDKRLQEIFSVNLGVIKGKFEFQEFKKSQQFDEEVEQL